MTVISSLFINYDLGIQVNSFDPAIKFKNFKHDHMKKMMLIISLLMAVQADSKGQNSLIAYNNSKISFAGNIISAGNLVTGINHTFIDSNIVVKDHAFYMQRSRNQRTAGLVLLGGGVLISGVGLLVSTNSSATLDQTATGVTIMGVGALAGIVSIPLMIMAHANRNKAKLMLSNQTTGYGIPFKSGELTGVTLSVALGR